MISNARRRWTDRRTSGSATDRARGTDDGDVDDIGNDVATFSDAQPPTNSVMRTVSAISRRLIRRFSNSRNLERVAETDDDDDVDNVDDQQQTSQQRSCSRPASIFSV